MNAPNFVGQPAVRQQPPRQATYQLHIRQQPERARVVVRGREKDRKPVDPPPILQFDVFDPQNAICSYLHNPYYFCVATLWDATRDQPKLPEQSPQAVTELLMGQLVSSLHRLKDQDNNENGFFVFGDISVAVLGKYRLRFSVYEYRPRTNDVEFLVAQNSEVIEVVSPKDWDGVKESTPLSRSFADQGVRLRLRKESRHSSKRTFSAPGSGLSTGPQTPLRPHPSQPGAQSSGYMQSTSQGWQPNTFAPSSGQQGQYPPYSPVGQAAPGYNPHLYPASSAGQYQPQSQLPYNYGAPPRAQGSDPAYNSSFGSPASGPYPTHSSAPYVQTASGQYVTASGALYSNPTYATLSAKYPGPGASYGSQPQQQSPYSSAGIYGSGQQASEGQQHPYSYPPPSSSQYQISQPYQYGQPPEEDPLRRGIRPMANPSTTPRLNPIHGIKYEEQGGVIASVEGDHAGSSEDQQRAHQRRQTGSYGGM